jgi:hypothetical protein
MLDAASSNMILLGKRREKRDLQSGSQPRRAKHIRVHRFLRGQRTITCITNMIPLPA